MHTVMRFIFLSILLVFSVSASPAPVGNLVPRAQSIRQTQLGASNGSRSADAPSLPWGPDEFEVIPIAESTPMPPLDCYMFVIGLIAKLGLNDWNSNLPMQVNVWKNARYPGITVEAVPEAARQRLPQRYVFWALARIMNRLTFGGFSGGVYKLTWYDLEIGSILFISGPVHQSISGYMSANLGQEVTNQTIQVVESTVVNQTDNSTSSIGVTEEVTWTYEFYGDPINQGDVFMGTIGALIQAAEYTNQNFDFFVGSFPRYRAIHTYLRKETPSRLSKEILLQTMVAVATHTQQQMNFHEMKTRISDSQGLIATGGYFSNPFA